MHRRIFVVKGCHEASGFWSADFVFVTFTLGGICRSSAKTTIEKFQWLESYDNQEYAMRWNDFTKGPSFLIAKDHSEQSITQTEGRTGQALFNCVRR